MNPAFLWGQNMTFLFVKIKFSHRLDAPGKVVLYKVEREGALEVQNMNISFKYDRFIFSALSFSQGAFIVHYFLEVETYNHLNTHFCSWKLDSVGKDQ